MGDCFALCLLSLWRDSLALVTARLGWPKVDFRLLRDRALEGLGFAVATSTTSIYNDIDKAMLSRYGMLAADNLQHGLSGH